MPVFTETLHGGAFIISEGAGFYSRDAVTVDASNPLVAGTVLGTKGVPADEVASAAAVASNSGNGALTLDATAPIAAAALDGIYEVIIRNASAPASFEVIGPDGKTNGFGTAGAVYAGAIKFVLAAGGTPFAIGDRFLVTVDRPHPAADLYEPLNLTATDGTQTACAILFDPLGADVAAAGTTKQMTVIARLAEVRLNDLTWPAGITESQIAEAQNQLRACGIDCL